MMLLRVQDMLITLTVTSCWIARTIAEKSDQMHATGRTRKALQKWGEKLDTFEATDLHDDEEDVDCSVKFLHQRIEGLQALRHAQQSTDERRL